MDKVEVEEVEEEDDDDEEVDEEARDTWSAAWVPSFSPL